MNTKQCTFCKETKLKTDFSPHPYCKGGVLPQCRQCKNFKIKWARIENKAKDMALSVDEVIALSDKLKEEPETLPQVKQVLTEEARRLLTIREAQVLSLRYDGWTLRRIGDKLSRSREAIRLIEKKAKYAISIHARHDVEFSKFSALDWLSFLRTSGHKVAIPATRDLMSIYSATNDLIFDPVLKTLIERAKNASENKDEWIGVCEELVKFMK